MASVSRSGLDRLERMVEGLNQTVKQFEAQYRNAVALMGVARAGLFPSATLNGAVTRAAGRQWFVRQRPQYFTASAAVYLGIGCVGPGCGARWAVMLVLRSALPTWRNAKLSAQATLAIDYFDLDAEVRWCCCCGKPWPDRARCRSSRTSTLNAGAVQARTW